MYRLRKSMEFEAAHQLPNHDGKCRNLHGHSYKVEVFVTGQTLMPLGSGPKEGMLVDFTVIGAELKKLHALLDHTFLNDSARLNLNVEVTTAEQLAKGIFMYLIDLETSPDFPALVEKVRVWETSSAYAEFES